MAKKRVTAKSLRAKKLTPAQKVFNELAVELKAQATKQGVSETYNDLRAVASKLSATLEIDLDLPDFNADIVTVGQIGPDRVIKMYDE